MFPTMNDAIMAINTIRPKYVFLTAKSGAGKTYFSNRLRDYEVLELDTVVRKIGERFGIHGPKAFAIYKSGMEKNIMDAFVQEIHLFFERYQSSPIAIEGAISDAALIRRIFSGPYAVFTFIYLYPNNVNAYATRMMQRFKHERKHNLRNLSIWPDVPKHLVHASVHSIELKRFMNKMARNSIQKSKERYDYFVGADFTIYRVDV